MKSTWGQMPQMRVLFSQSAKIRFLFLTLLFRFYGVRQAASPPPATGVQFLCRCGRLRGRACGGKLGDRSCDRFKEKPRRSGVSFRQTSSLRPIIWASIVLEDLPVMIPIPVRRVVFRRAFPRLFHVTHRHYLPISTPTPGTFNSTPGSRLGSRLSSRFSSRRSPRPFVLIWSRSRSLDSTHRS
jgi:hypothetical protein